MARVAICFLKKIAPYNAGEVAGFGKKVAEGYVKSGTAVYWDPKADAASLVKKAEDLARKAKEKALKEAEKAAKKAAKLNR